MKWKDTFREVTLAILPIIIIVTILHFTIAGIQMESYIKFMISSVMIIVGLVLFLVGMNIGILPVSRLIGSSLVERGRLGLILFFTFAIGVVVVIAEPQTQLLYSQVSMVSDDGIPKTVLIVAVAISVGVFLLLSMLRMFVKIPLAYLLAGSYAIVFILAAFTPQSFVAVSFDAGGVITGPLTVPFIMSLGVGVASVMGAKTSPDNSFGQIAMATVGPIIAVLLIGVIYG